MQSGTAHQMLPGRDGGTGFRRLVAEALAANFDELNLPRPEGASRSAICHFIGPAGESKSDGQTCFRDQEIAAEHTPQDELTRPGEPSQSTVPSESQLLGASCIERLICPITGESVSDQLPPPLDEQKAPNRFQPAGSVEEPDSTVVHGPKATSFAGSSCGERTTVFYGVLRLTVGALNESSARFSSEVKADCGQVRQTDTHARSAGGIEMSAGSGGHPLMPGQVDSPDCACKDHDVGSITPDERTRLDRTTMPPPVVTRKVLNRTDAVSLHPENSSPHEGLGASSTDKPLADRVSDHAVLSCLDELSPAVKESGGQLPIREHCACEPIELPLTAPRAPREWSAPSVRGVSSPQTSSSDLSSRLQALESASGQWDIQYPASGTRLRLLNLQVVTEAGSRVHLRLAMDRGSLHFSAATDDPEICRSLRCELPGLRSQLQRISPDVTVAPSSAPGGRIGDLHAEAGAAIGGSWSSSFAGQDSDRSREYLLDAWGESIDEGRYRRRGPQEKEVRFE
jgi:hypothetical protein